MAKWKTTRCLRNTVLFGTTALLILTANLLTVFGGFFYEPAVYVLFAANLLLNVSVFWDLGQHVRRDFPMLVFAGTFDILLLGRVYIAFFSDPAQLLYNLEAPNYENLFVALQVVNLSFLFVYAAYRLSGLLFARREKALREKGASAYPQSPLLPVIRQISAVVLLASSIAFFYVLLLSILNVFRTGSYLKSFTLVSETSVPTVISRMSLFFVPSFAVFLATLPDKKQLKWPMVVYTVYMLASLFTGRRNTFVTEALMIMIYFVMRDTLLKNDRRILKKRTVAIGAVVAVVGMYLLQVFAEVRAGGFKFDKNFLTLFSNFFYSQGASFRVVVQTVNKWDSIDHNISWQYLFYPFEMFIHNNQITRALFGFTPIVEVQNLAFVQYTHNYAHVLTYMVDPGRYLSGGGFGTSFVAEAYVAYGLPGVAVVSMLVGLIFRFFSTMLTRSWPVLASCLIAIKDFVYIPRSFAFLWVTDVFNLTYLCFYIGVYLLALFLVWASAHTRASRGIFEKEPPFLEGKT